MREAGVSYGLTQWAQFGLPTSHGLLWHMGVCAGMCTYGAVLWWH